MEWIALVLFLLIVLSWVALPNSKKAETEMEMSQVEYSPVTSEKA